MIDKASNFEEDVRFLSDDLDKDIAGELKLQDNLLNSQTFNETMSAIEKELNTLYEKTRALEDIIAYTKEFLIQEIHSNKEKIQNKLETIENARDSIKESAYVSFRAPIKASSTETIRDRDGTTVDQCEISQGNLTMSSQLLEEAKIVSVEKRQEFNAHSDNLDAFLANGYYRSFYLLEKPARDGVREELVFLFDDAVTINSISGIPVNCDILNVAIINKNGAEENGIAFNNSIIAERKARGVKVTLVSHDYDTQTYDIDAARVKKNFWDDLPDYEYNRILNRQNEYDMQKASGLRQYEEAYDDYLKELDTWYRDQQAVNDRNRLKLLKYANEEDV